MRMREIKDIKFIVRTDVDDEMIDGSSNTYGVLQVRNVDEDDVITEISELKVTPDEIDELISLLEATKKLIFKQANE